MAIGVLMLLLGIVALIIAFGLYGLKPWAWKAAFIVVIILLIVSIVNIGLGGWTSVINLVIYIVILFYLTRPEIKACFFPGMPIAGPAPMGPPPGGPPMGPPPGGPMGPPPGAPPPYGGPPPPPGAAGPGYGPPPSPPPY